tara:strand:- start:31227 stop:31706 length:480 start_codon:yes stop_codon:yes gene_type:complete
MNNVSHQAKKFLENSVFSFGLESSEMMVVWSLRHWTDCISSKENPRDLFSLCTEQHNLPDISFIFEEITLAIKDGATEKGVIGGEFCNHLHYGEYKILAALYFLQNDNFENARESFSSWLKPEESRIVYKLLISLSIILEKADLLIPSRKEFQAVWRPH